MPDRPNNAWGVSLSCPLNLIPRLRYPLKTPSMRLECPTSIQYLEAAETDRNAAGGEEHDGEVVEEHGVVFLNRVGMASAVFLGFSIP